MPENPLIIIAIDISLPHSAFLLVMISQFMNNVTKKVIKKKKTRKISHELAASRNLVKSSE